MVAKVSIKNKILFISLIILLSCEKEKIEYDDINLGFIYYIELDSLNRVVNYGKTYENNHLIEQVEVIFNIDNVVYKRLNSNQLLLEKKVYHLDINGLAFSSIDTVFGENMGITKINYYYNNDYLVKSDVISFKYLGHILIDSVNYTILNEIINDDLIKTIYTIDGFDCSDLLTNSQFTSSIDVTNFTNGLLGKNFKLVESKILSYGCPCGPSSTSSKKTYDYILDEENRLLKQIETYEYCHHVNSSPISREITTIEYNYYNRNKR